ncbi:hypothetical protein CI238_07304, partial [Colletotrichum incanum]
LGQAGSLGRELSLCHATRTLLEECKPCAPCKPLDGSLLVFLLIFCLPWGAEGQLALRIVQLAGILESRPFVAPSCPARSPIVHRYPSVGSGEPDLGVRKGYQSWWSETNDDPPHLLRITMVLLDEAAVNQVSSPTFWPWLIY